MKKFLCLICAVLLLCTSVAHAESFLYFYSGDMALPAAIDAGNMAKVGNTYYATDAEGRLWMTQIFGEWLQAGYAPKNCRIISTHRADADKLFVYADATLYTSTDGAVFTPTETFATDAVLRYNCGMFTAVSKAENGYALRFSFDGTTWYDFTKTMTASVFSVLRLGENSFVLKNVQTAEGTTDVLLHKTLPEMPEFYTKLVYDVASGIAIDDPNFSGADLIYADSPADGKFLYVYAENKPNGRTYQSIRMQNGTITAWNTVLTEEEMQLYVYGETLCLAKNNKSLNYINKENKWVQVSEDMAFPLIQSAYNLSGDFFFDNGYTTKYYCRNTTPMILDRAGIEVILKDNYLAFDSAPQIVNDRTMVPVRAIAEALGCTVTFDEATREISIRRNDGVALYMILGSNTAKIVWTDGVSAPLKLDASPVIYDNRTLVPLRFVCENFDLTATWVEETKTVVLN